MELWNKVKKGTKRLLAGPTREDYPEMSDEDFAQMAEGEAQAKTSAIEGITDTVASLGMSKTKKPNQALPAPIKFASLRFDQAEPVQMKMQKMKPFDIEKMTNSLKNKQVSDLFQTDSEQLIQTARRNKQNPLRHTAGLYDVSNISKGLSVGISGAVVVSEGMSERAASNFGVFTQGAVNREGLLKRRTDAQAKGFGSFGNRG